MISSSLTHVQSTPSMAWTINHSFNGAPICDVTSTVNGTTVKVLPSIVRYLSNSEIVIEFSEPMIGVARLVGKLVPTEVVGPGSVDMGQSL